MPNVYTGIMLQDETRKGVTSQVKCRHIKMYPELDECGNVARTDEGKMIFHRLKNPILRVQLEYQCHDGSKEIHWITETTWGFKFHYAPTQVHKEIRRNGRNGTIKLYWEEPELKDNAEKSMKAKEFIAFLMKKMPHLAAEVMQTFSDKKAELFDKEELSEAA